jgi:hypothetical protein
MRFVTLFLLLLALLPAAHAQIGFNSPAGITPQLDAEIYTNNGFLVQERFIAPSGQQKAIHPFCGSAPVDVSGDLLMAAYAAQSFSSVCFSTVRCTPRPVDRTLIGVQITVNVGATATPNNDRIWLRFNTPSGPQSYSFGFPTSPSSFTLQQTFRVALGPLDDEFRAEWARGNSSPAGMRFYVRWQYLYAEPIRAYSIPAFRHAFMFDTFRGAFRAGTVSLPDLMDMGEESIALGFENQALAPHSIAIGTNVKADGAGAIAMGRNLSTNKQPGTFVIGDADPSGDGTVPVNAPNQFVARFQNGYQLFTNTTPGKLAGVVLGKGQNSWGSASDSTKKERLRPIDHADLLRKVNAMKLTTWNYKGQHEIRHYGPMAQDFYAAFGHDGLGQVGCDTLIYSHDFAGVTFAGVQALIRENEQLKRELAQQKAEAQRARYETRYFASLQTEMNNRLQLLERAMLNRRERVMMRRKSTHTPNF